MVFVNFRLGLSILILLLSLSYKFDTNNFILLDSKIYIYFLLAYLLSSYITSKHEREFYRNLIEFLNPYLKSYLLLFLIVLLVNFLVYDMGLIFVLIKTIIYALTELLFFITLWITVKNKTPLESKTAIFNKKKSFQQRLSISKKGDFFSLSDFLKLDNQVYDNLNDLSNFLKDKFDKFLVTDKVGLNSLSTDLDHNILFSKQRINFSRSINADLSSSYKRIVAGGYFILNYEPLDIRTDRVRFKFFDHFIHSALPTIPLIRDIYLYFYGGQNRVLSRAELWGRLHYAGFEVQKEMKVGSDYIIFSQKMYEPSDEKNPSYYPIITLDRVGFNGEIIKIHKIRTMYPYSEFIQKKVFEMSALSSIGKFDQDFRVTNMGKILRKYWFDELPQIIDWFRGNIKIVGIRAMSLHYFSLYPERYQDKYYTVKPGFISPIFDEKTSSFEDIVTIEEKYLTSYKSNPFMTDIRYFILTITDILFRGKLSS